MYIQKLNLENWRNFQKPGEITLGRRLFLIGPNASGKSNFLDVFRFLKDLCISGGGLQKAVEKRGGVSIIRCLHAHRYPNIVIDIKIADENGRDGSWRYRLSFTQDNLRRPVIKEELVEHDGKVLLKRPSTEDEADSLRLTQTAVEQVTTNKEFRAVVSFFQSVSYQHLLPQVIRDPKGFSPGKVENDPYGRDFLQAVESAEERTKKSRLKKILNALKVAAPQLKDLKVDRDKLGVPHLIGVFDHWRARGAKQNESQLSDGTLRLFGLLWSLLEGDGPLLMEEPELSLHSGVVRHLPQMMARINLQRKNRRQVIISTHSDDMLRDTGIGGEEVLRLEPSTEGTLLKSCDADERTLLESGLSAADVILPKSAPKNPEQLALCFGK